jgi:hypothetical protein
MLRRGRNFAVAECDVRDHDGRLAAKALLTFAINPSGIPKLRLPPEKKQGRKRRK